MKCRKRVCSLLIATMVLTFIPAGNAFAANSNIAVYVDGNPLSFDASPIIENGRTLVPMRAIFESLNANVDWNNDTKTVTATTEWLMSIQLTIGDVNAEKYFAVPTDDYNYETMTGSITKDKLEKIKLDVPAKIISGRTFVPLRFIAETMSYQVNYNNDTKRVDINTGAFVPTDNSATTSATTTQQYSDFRAYVDSAIDPAVIEMANWDKNLDPAVVARNPEAYIGQPIYIEGNFAWSNKFFPEIHAFQTTDGQTVAVEHNGISYATENSLNKIYGYVSGIMEMKKTINGQTIPVDELKISAKYIRPGFNQTSDTVGGEIFSMYGNWISENRDKSLVIDPSNITVYDSDGALISTVGYSIDNAFKDVSGFDTRYGIMENVDAHLILDGKYGECRMVLCYMDDVMLIMNSYPFECDGIFLKQQ